MALPFKHATVDQLVAAWRERYAQSTGVETGRLAHLMQTWLDAGDVADDKLRGAFGATVAQYAQIKGRLTAAAQRYRASKADRGE